MIGVNLDALNSLIKKNNLYYQSFNDDAKNLIRLFNELNDCYKGESLNFLFNEPKSEVKNIKTIAKVIDNYSDVLTSVKLGYQKQDKAFKSQINQMKTNL